MSYNMDDLDRYFKAGLNAGLKELAKRLKEHNELPTEEFINKMVAEVYKNETGEDYEL